MAGSRTTTAVDDVATPGNLAPLELQALAVAGKDARKWRDQLPVGKHQAVDFLVRVRGEIDVAADDPTATTTVKPDLERCLALLMAELPKTRRRDVAARIVRRYADAEPLDPQMAALAKSISESLAAKHQQLRRGNVSGRVSVSRRAG